MRPDIDRTVTTIEDYAATTGRMVSDLLAKDGKQPGDPVRAALAITDAVDADEPPLDLILGDDAIRRARARLEQLHDDVTRWLDVAQSTDVELISQH